MIFSEGLKVTNNFDLSLLTAAGALFVGEVWAKQIFPSFVSTVKLSQFLDLPVDLGVLAKELKENIGTVDIDLSDEIIEKINLIHANNPNPTP